MKSDTIRVTEEIANLLRDMTPAERSHVLEVGLCVIRDNETWGPQHLKFIVEYLIKHAKGATVENIVSLAHRCAVDAVKAKSKREAAV